MNLRSISRNVGFALLVSALFMFLCIVLSICEGNDSALAALIISFLITFTVGIFPFIFVRKTAPITLKEGFVVITLSWLLSFVFGMLPYALWGGPFTLQNAWFESVSGFTTTGATILDNVEALPDSLLLWRASTHFIGGLGVVVFLLLVIPGSSPVRMRLTNMELSSISRSGYAARANKTVYIFAFVYLGLTVVAFITYLICGMKPLDAICHAMSVCAAGGFSTRNLSIASFHSPLIEIVTIVFMYLASIHFGLIFLVFATRSFKPLKNPVLKFYSLAILVSALLVSISLRFSGQGFSLGTSIRYGLFQTLSVASTTGFAVVDNASWPMLPCFILMILGIMCGCAGSTTGGIKADRVLVLLKSIALQIKKILHPSSVNELRLGRKFLYDDEVVSQVVYVSFYFVILLLSMLVTLVAGANPEQAFAGSLSSLGNVGPAIGEIGNMGNYNLVPAGVKLIFTLDMFLGRVEIYPVIAVIAMLFDSRKN